MKLNSRITTTASLLGLAAWLTVGLAPTAVFAQRGGIDPRAEDRTYHFEDTDEDMQYCVFASSKVSADTPAPLIVSLHGLGAGPQIMCNATAIDLAEEGGYILAAPMGYSPSGWYGSPVLGGGRGRGRGGDGQGATGRGGNPGNAALSFDGINGDGDDHLTIEEVRGSFGNAFAGRGGRGGNDDGGDFVATIFSGWDANGDGMVTEQEFDDRPQTGGRGAGGGFGGGNQPENLAELSEKDVMNVLAMVREEFNVDDDRIYLTGHSMGGAGTYFLGSKHADIWAAIAPVAAAAFSLDHAATLQPLKDAGVPILVVHGDMDELVPVDTARQWVASMEEMGIEHDYVELPGVSHGPIITASQEDVYEFFDNHSK